MDTPESKLEESTLTKSLTASASTEPSDEVDFAALLREDDAARATAVDRSGGSKQIDATVVAVSIDAVYLDIGYKTEGILPLTSFGAEEKAVETGDRFRVTVKGRDADGYYELTRQRTATPKDYSSLEEAFEAKGTVLGTVTGVVKGGLTVDIGMRAFLPASRSGTRDAAEMDKLVGREIRVRITQLDLEGGGDSGKGGGRPDAIVDRRSVLEEETKANSDQRFSELTEGQTVRGTVRSLTDFRRVRRSRWRRCSAAYLGHGVAARRQSGGGRQCRRSDRGEGVEDRCKRSGQAAHRHRPEAVAAAPLGFGFRSALALATR